MDTVVQYLKTLGERPTQRVEQHTYQTTNSAEDLKQAGVITDTTTQVTRHNFVADGRTVASCTYALYTEEAVGYISDLHVTETLRGNGVGTALRTAALTELQAEAAAVYSYPTNDTIKHIADEQGFEPVQDEPLDGWYVAR